MGTLTQSEVLYMEIPKGPLACSKCVLWIKPAERCVIHPPDTKVTGRMICNLFVPGEPVTEGEGQGNVTPEVSGLGAGNTNCGNCRWGVEACCTHPMLEGWPVDMQNGCCNAWTEPEEEDEEGHGLAETIHIIIGRA